MAVSIVAVAVLGHFFTALLLLLICFPLVFLRYAITIYPDKYVESLSFLNYHFNQKNNADPPIKILLKPQKYQQTTHSRVNHITVPLTYWNAYLKGAKTSLHLEGKKQKAKMIKKYQGIANRHNLELKIVD